MCIGYRRSRNWLGRGCTESKRTAILSGLTIHSPLHTLHNPYNLCLPLFSDISGVRYVDGTATRYHRYNTEATVVFTKDGCCLAL